MYRSKNMVAALILVLAACMLLVSCGGSAEDAADKQEEAAPENSAEVAKGEALQEGTPEKELVLTIDGKAIKADWEDNESVSELKELAASGPVKIEMEEYGGFEQGGPIGKSITSTDEQMTAKPGDIMLYSGNQIVVFYGSNSWSYTRLGKIKGMDEEAINSLLNKDNVEFELSVE